MRVLYLTMNPNRASTTATLEGWLRLLRARGLEPVVVTNQAGAFFKWVVEQKIPAYHFPLPWPDRKWPLPFLHCLWKLRTVVKRHRCQLIHSNEHDIYPVAQRLARICGLPAIVGVRFTMARGFCEYAFRGARRPTRMFFVSHGSQEACRPALDGLVPEADWRMFYNGADLTQFKPDSQAGIAFRQQHGLGSGLLLGAASALRPVKQLEHLFESIYRLKMPGVKLVLAGGPVPEYLNYADQLLRDGKAKLGGRLVSVGHLDDIRPFLNAIDLFVGTSQEEGCSNSVLQALACGCPVISYPSTSVHEQVLPDGGAIVEQDRIDELTLELDAWLADAPRRDKGRIGARARAERLFDIRRIADQVWEEYCAVLAEEARPPGAPVR